jgi:signal peptidase I
MKSRNLSIALYGLLAAIIVGLALTVHFLGISAYVITGASMTGEISKGSVAIDRRVPVSSLQVGDVITFQPPGHLGNVTHRIVALEKDADGNPVFRTKGDFNDSVDPWRFTLDRQSQAKYAFHIPYVGYALAVFTFRPVRTALLVIVALLILGVTISWLRKTPEDDDEEEPCASASFCESSEA